MFHVVAKHYAVFLRVLFQILSVALYR